MMRLLASLMKMGTFRAVGRMQEFECGEVELEVE